MSARTTPKGVSARTLTIVAVLVLIAAVAAAFYLLTPRGTRSAVRAAAPTRSDESTAAVLGDEFPRSPEPRLRNPLGITWTGQVLAVAESDAGRIALFDLDGVAKGNVAVPRAAGAPQAYPVSVAAIGESLLAVVDTSGNRVVVVPVDPEASASKVRFGPVAPKKPTAVGVIGDEVFIADAGDRDIKVYDLAGTFLRSIGGLLSPRLTFVGGMWGTDGVLVAADSNAGRVLVLDPRNGSDLGLVQARLDLPRGVAGDGAGTIFVVDQFGRTIHAAGADRRELWRIGGSGETDIPLGEPRGVAFVGGPPRLFVTDASTGTVKRFDLVPED